MSHLPPEDQPDAITIGPIGPIPVFHDDDPRFEQERAAWSVATRKAQAMHSADELLGGLCDADWRVRHEVVDRLIARWRDDPRTLPSLLAAARGDSAWEVRDAVVMRLQEFESELVIPVLRAAELDDHPDVRWSASYSLAQLGEPPTE